MRLPPWNKSDRGHGSELERKFWRWCLTVYWATLCLGTHLPGGVIVTPPVSDKVLHFAAYAGLGFLLALLAPRLGLRGWRVYAALLLIAVCYGAIDELGQIPVPGRNADMADWAADMLGVAAGLRCIGWRSVPPQSGRRRRWSNKKSRVRPDSAFVFTLWVCG